MLRRTNREPFGRQLIKAPCFTRATVRLLCGAVRVGKPAEPACKSSYMYISEVREVSGYGSCGTKCGKAHQSTIWGIDESINGTGLPKRACKKMPVPFRHWHFISIQGKIDAYSRKAKKKGRSDYMKSHKFFAWATVFCFVMTMITGYKRQ